MDIPPTENTRCCYYNLFRFGHKQSLVVNLFSSTFFPCGIRENSKENMKDMKPFHIELECSILFQNFPSCLRTSILFQNILILFQNVLIYIELGHPNIVQQRPNTVSKFSNLFQKVLKMLKKVEKQRKNIEKKLDVERMLKKCHIIS